MKKILFFVLCMGIIWYLYDSHEYYNKEHIEIDKYGEVEKTYEKIKNYDSYLDETSDSVRYSQKAIFLFSNGGKIEANCSNGYKIFIESKGNKQSSSSIMRIYYTFPTKQKYDEALAYIRRKGYRWIVNYQTEKEWYTGIEREVSIERENGLDFVNTIYLNEMRFVD